MRRFRTYWLALFGATVILSLSLSSAFGARPTGADDESTNFGQQVSTFVHTLLTGDEEGDQDEACDTDEGSTPDEDTDETPTDEPTDTDEDGVEDTEDEESEDTEDTEEGTDACDTDEDAAEDEDADEESEESEDSEFKNHGQCVAQVARDPEAVGENGTHGWAVSLAARVDCREQFADPDNTEDEDADESEDTDEESDATEDTADSETQRGKSAEAHQRKEDRGSGKPSWAGLNAGGHGHGHGHGKGNPHN